MSPITGRSEWMTSTRYLGPAQVLEVDVKQDRVRLRLAGSDDEIGVWARVAIPGATELRNGNTILVIGDEPDELYAIGLLNRKVAPAATPARLALSSGAYADASRLQGDESLRIFSKDNELLLEYNETKGRTRINVERGNLEFTVQDGSIVFASGREILFHGQSVGITGVSAIRLEIAHAIGKIRSALTLLPNRSNLTGSDLGISAGHAELNVDETEYKGRDFTGTLRSARLAADRLETTAHSIVEKAKNTYRTVEQLTQLRTGRLRTLVSSTFHFKARRAFVKAEQDYRIKAEKIHLG
jgi:Protein of unknown function (DUF3540)